MFNLYTNSAQNHQCVQFVQYPSSAPLLCSSYTATKLRNHHCVYVVQYPRSGSPLCPFCTITKVRAAHVFILYTNQTQNRHCVHFVQYPISGPPSPVFILYKTQAQGRPFVLYVQHPTSGQLQCAFCTLTIRRVLPVFILYSLQASGQPLCSIGTLTKHRTTTACPRFHKCLYIPEGRDPPPSVHVYIIQAGKGSSVTSVHFEQHSKAPIDAAALVNLTFILTL